MAEESDEDDWSPRREGPIDISGWTVPDLGADPAPDLSASYLAAVAAAPMPESADDDEDGDLLASAAAAAARAPSSFSVRSYLLAASMPLPASPASLGGVMTPEGPVTTTGPNADDLPVPEPLESHPAVGSFVDLLQRDPEVDSFLAMLEQEMDRVNWPRDDETQGDAPTAAAEALARSVASVVAEGDAPTNDTPRDASAMTEHEPAMGSFEQAVTDEWPAADADGDALMAEMDDDDDDDEEAPTDEWAHNDSEGDAPMADAADDDEVPMDDGSDDVVMDDAQDPVDLEMAAEGMDWQAQAQAQAPSPVTPVTPSIVRATPAPS